MVSIRRHRVCILAKLILPGHGQTFASWLFLVLVSRIRFVAHTATFHTNKQLANEQTDQEKLQFKIFHLLLRFSTWLLVLLLLLLLPSIALQLPGDQTILHNKLPYWENINYNSRQEKLAHSVYRNEIFVLYWLRRFLPWTCCLSYTWIEDINSS